MPVLRLDEHRVEGGATVPLDGPGHRILYVVEGTARLGGVTLGPNEAAYHRGTSAIEADAAAHVLVWTLGEASEEPAKLAAEIDLPDDEVLLRCDRVDFPPGGVAFLHTHQGPGIRCLVLGAFRVETEGHVQEIPLHGAWFEAGPAPVYAEVAGDGPAAFVRVMVLPRRLLGQSSIRYVRDEDRDKPKSQRYTVLVDQPL